MIAEPVMATPDILALQRAVTGRYAIEREIGRGGMGLVLLARDLALDRLVAIKLLPAALAADGTRRARFVREARIAAGLSHPNVVAIYAVEEHTDAAFFAMAYIDGETLGERVRRAGPLPPSEVTRVLREVAWALAYAHGRGVVHRDIKPENILIERGSGRALVTDFGIAQSVTAPSRLTRDGEIMGSVAFMSPEQAAAEPVDGRSDLYAFGGVGFYLLTGRPPFEASTAASLLVHRLTLPAPPIASVRPEVPPRLAAVVDRCLARAPEARFPSAEAVAEALGAASGTAGVEDIAAPVRSFARAAEQTMWLVWLVVAFTVLYGLPATRNLGVLAVGIIFGATVVCVDRVRRARELLAEGYQAGDVRSAFARERQAHEAELRVLFDARRMAADRRTRRRAWAVLGVAIVVKAVTLVRLLHHAPNDVPGAIWFVATVLADLVTAVSFVIAINASPRAERRFFRLTARLWEGRFGPVFFRLAAVGRRRSADGASSIPAGASDDVVPPEMAVRFPDFVSVLRQLEATYGSLGAREADVTRAVAAAGLPANDSSTGSDDGAAGPLTAAHHTLAALREHRDELLADLRHALETTRVRRTALAAARENIRVQLLRVGAGVGVPDDLAVDLAAARALLAVETGDPAVGRTAPGSSS